MPDQRVSNPREAKALEKNLGGPIRPNSPLHQLLELAASTIAREMANTTAPAPGDPKEAGDAA